MLEFGSGLQPNKLANRRLEILFIWRRIRGHFRTFAANYNWIPAYVAGGGVVWWWGSSTVKVCNIKGIALQGALLTLLDSLPLHFKTGLLRAKLT